MFRSNFVARRSNGKTTTIFCFSLKSDLIAQCVIHLQIQNNFCGYRPRYNRFLRETWKQLFIDYTNRLVNLQNPYHSVEYISLMLTARLKKF